MTAGDRYELERFNDFNSALPNLPAGQLPAVTHITARIVPDASVRTIELETGAAHILFDVAASEAARIKEHADLNMFETPGFALNSWLGFNTGKEPFNDIRVRQAVSLALDIPTIVEVAWAGLGNLGTSVIPQSIPGFISFPVPEVNIERAKQLMVEAGYADGFQTDIWLNEGNMMRADAATMVQAQLRALNIETTINIYEWARLLPDTSAGLHQMSIMGWTTATGDPDYGLYPLYHSSTIDGDNRTFTNIPRVDQLLDQGRQETDPAARMAIYAEIQTILMEQLVVIPLWESVEMNATRNNINGFRVQPNGNFPLWLVSIAD